MLCLVGGDPRDDQVHKMWFHTAQEMYSSSVHSGLICSRKIRKEVVLLSHTLIYGTKILFREQ